MTTRPTAHDQSMDIDGSINADEESGKEKEKATNITRHPSRRAYIDGLNVLVTFSVITFHVNRFFDTSPDYPKHHGDDRGNIFAYYMERYTVSIATWTMPLIFTISGLNAYLSLSFQRGPAKYMKERFLRILLPLISAFFLFVIPEQYITYGIDEGRSFPDFVYVFLTTNGNAQHLWTLFVVYAYSVVNLPVILVLKRMISNQKLTEMRSTWVSLIAYLIIAVALGFGIGDVYQGLSVAVPYISLFVAVYLKYTNVIQDERLTGLLATGLYGIMIVMNLVSVAGPPDLRESMNYEIPGITISLYGAVVMIVYHGQYYIAGIVLAFWEPLIKATITRWWNQGLRVIVPALFLAFVIYTVPSVGPNSGLFHLIAHFGVYEGRFQRLVYHLYGWIMCLVLYFGSQVCWDPPRNTDLQIVKYIHSILLPYLHRASYFVYLVQMLPIGVISYYYSHHPDLPLSEQSRNLVMHVGAIAGSLGAFQVARQFKVTRVLFGIKR